VAYVISRASPAAIAHGAANRALLQRGSPDAPLASHSGPGFYSPWMGSGVMDSLWYAGDGPGRTLHRAREPVDGRSWRHSG